MPGTTLARRGQLVRELCVVLRGQPDGMPASEALGELASRLPPTEYESERYPRNPSSRRYEKIVRFSSINAVKAEWLVKDKGVWTLTEDGAKALDLYSDPEAFYREAKRLYREWERGQPSSDVHETEPTEDEAADIATTFEEAEEAAWSELRQYIGSMPPYEFQDLVAALLQAMGYFVLWKAPPGPDRGIDLIAYNDPLGTSSPRIVVQVKRRPEHKIAAEELRSFMAVLGDRDVGIFITAGAFTSEAEREARSQERRRLTLINLTRLVELWIEHYRQLDDADRQRLPLKPVYFLAPTTSASGS